MTYLEIVQLLMNTARRSPNINTVVREFTDLNREGIEYSAIVIQDRDGYREYINNQDYITYTWYIGYVDMLTEEAVNVMSYPAPKTIDNRDDIVSTGINVINDIINTINNSYYPHLELSVSDRINTFHQRFTAECAGVYLVLNANVPLSDCSESAVKLFDKISDTITENGVYHYTPSGDEVAYDGVDITVNVPSAKPEERLIEEVTSNGYYSYSPSEGSVFSDVNINVAVPTGIKPEESLVESISSNGSFSFSPSEGSVFSDVSIDVDVHPSVMLSRRYTSNGVKTIAGEWKDAEITIAVPIKEEEQLSKVVTSNGNYSFLPSSPNNVISKVDLAVDVHPSRLYGNTFTSNGYYVVNEEFAAAYITVSVPSSAKPEETLVETINSNGSFSFSPSSGYVFSDASIAVDVHPSSSLSRTYTSNGSYNISGEFSGGEITVAVTTTITVTMSQAQYDALAVKDPNTIYLING